MKRIASLAYITLAASIFLTGCATQSTPQTKQATLTSVPQLKVTIDCGGCAVRPDVPPRLSYTYDEAAAQAGVKVSSTEQATAVIRSYSERNDVARFMAGAFAGKDELKVEVKSGGKVFIVEDYFRNAFQGMDDLVKYVGVKIFMAMSKADAQ